MKDILADLYYGEIMPNACAIGENGHFAAVMKTLSDCEEKLTNLLVGKEKSLFLDFCNAHSESEGTLAFEKFKYGFIFGARLIIEIFF